MTRHVGGIVDAVIAKIPLMVWIQPIFQLVLYKILKNIKNFRKLNYKKNMNCPVVVNRFL